MNSRIPILCVLLALLAACGDDPTGPSRSRPLLRVEARGIDANVDHGWMVVDGMNDERHRMEVEEGVLVVTGVSVEPGPHGIEVTAVDANESGLFAGVISTTVPDGVDTTEVRLELVAARPDLVLRELGHEPDRPLAGDTTTVFVIVGNGGVGVAGPTTMRLRVGAEVLGTFHEVPLLEPGEQVRFERTVVFAQAEIYQLYAFVDPRNDVMEFSEQNNAAIGLVQVDPPPTSGSR